MQRKCASSLMCLVQSLALAGGAFADTSNPAPASWPIFRGNPGLTGIATGTLPAKLTQLWSFKTGGPVKSSAVIGGGMAFIGSDDGNIYALDFATGQKAWSYNGTNAISAPPLLVSNTVYVGTTEGMFYALDAKTGALRWKFQTDGKIAGSANLVPVNDGPPRLLVGSWDFKLYCLDLISGKPVWTYETGNYINGTPAVANGQTAFGGCDEVLHVVSLSDGTKIKEMPAGAYVAASVAMIGDRAYYGHYDNEFVCADLKAGEMAWKFHDRDFPYMSSPAVTSDRVLFGGNDKRLHCVNRVDGKTIWSFATRGKVESSPVVVGDKVVVGSDDGSVYLVSLDKGEEVWSHELGQPVASSPAVAGEKIVIGCDDGSVYCFGATK